jgi:hypothetical protein
MYSYLNGCPVFTRNKGIISKIVRYSGLFSKSDGGLFHISKYSHVGIIFTYPDSNIPYVLQIKPPKVSIQPLIELVGNKKDEFLIKNLAKSKQLIIKDNKKELTDMCMNLVGTDYGYLSAVCSGLDKPFDFKTSKGLHCSSQVAKIYQDLGIISKDLDVKEFTPDNLLNLPIYL